MDAIKQAKLRGLTPQELQLLAYFFENRELTNGQLGKKMGVSEKHIGTLLTGIYKKLSIKGIANTKKDTLYQEYKEDFEALKNNPEHLKAESISPTPPRPRLRPSILIVGILGGFLLISIIVIAVLLNTLRSLNQGEVESPIVQATSTAAILATVPDSTSEAVILPSVTNTYFLNLPTQTPNPTHTPKPTPLPTPKITLPFEDNFDNGINPAWTVQKGTWITANGKLTIVFTEYGVDWILLDEPTLTNYRVTADINVPVGSLEIAVRYPVRQEELLVYKIGPYGHNCWAFDDGRYTNCVVEENDYASDYLNLRLEVSGSNYTAYIDGREIQSFTLTDREKGGIAVGIWCQRGFECPTADNFKVEALP